MALVFALLLAGCGITQILDITRKIQATNDSNRLRLAPSWPIAMQVEIGEAQIAWGKVQKSLDEQLGKSGASTSVDASGVPIILPPATDIAPIKLGDKMKIDQVVDQDIATISLGIPVTSKTIAATTIRLSDTPAGQTTFNFPPPIGAQRLSNAKTAAVALGIADTVGLPSAASLTRVERKEQEIPDVQSATLDAGSLTVPLANDTAGLLTVEIRLSDGAGQILGSRTETLAPRSTGSLSFNLAGKTITSPLITDATTSGEIPAGTTLDRIEPDTDKIVVGPTTIAMDASQAKVHLTAQQGRNPAAAGYNAALADIIQDFDVTANLPADSGIKQITSVTIASGSLLLDITNGFGVDGDVRLEFQGIKNINRDPLGPMVKNSDGSFVLRIDSRSQATASLDLAGADIEPDPTTGKIRVRVSPATLDTDYDRTHGPARPPAHNYTVVGKGDQLFGKISLGRLTFARVKGSFDSTQAIPTSEVPVDLPREFAETGIQPARVSIKLVIRNQSQISGRLTPAISGIKDDGTILPIRLEGPSAAHPREPFRGDFLGANDANATRSTTIEINERNSNIVEVLRAGAKKMRFGGQTRVFGSNVTLGAADLVGGKVEIEIPLALIVEPFGVGTSRKPFDIQPASPLGIDAGTKAQIEKFVKGVGLDFRIENGWRLPLTIGLLFSEQDDPYADGAAAFTRTLALGSGPLALSTLDLNEDEARKLGKIKKLGIRISSPGSGGRVVELHRTDLLKIRIAARVKAQVGPELMQGTKGL